MSETGTPVTLELKAAPYPPGTRAKGWRFELDLERIEQSDTWALAPTDLRPWLLMLWATAWKQVPCGSLSDDDDLIAVRIGMKPAAFKKNRLILMRGWWKAEDGKLYHDTVASRVLEMLDIKDKERQRKADYRKRMAATGAPASGGAPDLSHGTELGQGGDGRGGDTGRDDTGTGTGTYLISVPDGTEPPATSPAGSPSAPAAGTPPAAPPAPKPRKLLSPEEQAKSEVWKAAVSVLEHGDCPASQCRTFMGKLVTDYGYPIVKEAVAAAVTEQPADARGYLTGICQRLKGTRKNRQEDLELSNLGAAARFAGGG